MSMNYESTSIKDLTLEELSELMDKGALEDREGLCNDDILYSLEYFINNALQEAEKTVMLLGVDSKIFSDLVWQEFYENIESGEKLKIGHRIRVNNGTLEIMYVKNVYQKGGRYYADQVKRSRKFEYLRKDFRFASQWEQDLVVSFEDIYKINRKIFSHISEARRHLRKAIKEVAKKEG